MTDQERGTLTDLRDSIDHLLAFDSENAKELGFDYLRLVPVVLWLLQRVFDLLREHLEARKSEPGKRA